eukprot:458814_1
MTDSQTLLTTLIDTFANVANVDDPIKTASKSSHSSDQNILHYQESMNAKPQPSKSNENATNTDCSGLIKSGCECFRRVDAGLKYYQSLNLDAETHQQNMMEYFNEKYKHFLDDYIHILLKHNDEIGYIYNTIISNQKQNNICDLAKCSSAKRHYRDRTTENKNDKSVDNNILFHRDTLDSAHCYFTHLYDFGLRSAPKNIQNSNEDPLFEKMKKIINEKSKQLKPIHRKRYEKNKFSLNVSVTTSDDTVTYMDGLKEHFKQTGKNKLFVSTITGYLEQEEFDSDALKHDVFSYENWENSNIYHYLQNYRFSYGLSIYLLQ